MDDISHQRAYARTEVSRIKFQIALIIKNTYCVKRSNKAIRNYVFFFSEFNFNSEMGFIMKKMPN